MKTYFKYNDFKLNKRKFSLIIMCSIILFGVCGCGKPKEDPIKVEKYVKALNYMSKEANSPSDEFNKYDIAKDIFEELGNFRDSKEKAEECYTKLITSGIKVGEEFINNGDIWGAKNWLTYKFETMPTEIEEFLQRDIFNLIGDWNFKAGRTSLRIDLANKMGHFDLVATNASTYNTGYWKIKNNKLYFCNLLLDKEDDNNYKELFTIVSYTRNTLVIKNSQQSFTLTK